MWGTEISNTFQTLLAPLLVKHGGATLGTKMSPLYCLSNLKNTHHKTRNPQFSAGETRDLAVISQGIKGVLEKIKGLLD